MGQACTTEDRGFQKTEFSGCHGWVDPSSQGTEWTGSEWPSSARVGFPSIPKRNDDNFPDEAISCHGEVPTERTDTTNAEDHGPSTWPVINMDILYREHMALLKKAGLKISTWGRTDGGELSKDDTLLVVDMQNDFLPGKFAPWGGRAAVSEGEATVEPVCQLIEAFSSSSALIVATRAFHPFDHISFYEQGGQSPTHCVQTSAGSGFYPSVGDALHRAYTEPKWEVADNGLPGQAGRVEIAFKGFLESIASPGAFRYSQDHFEERLKNCRWDIDSCPLPGAARAGMGTGAMALKCSGLPNDINSNPDLSALLQRDLRPLDEVVPRSGRLLIVGLGLDTAILDSAVAASRLGYEKVFVAIDACRPWHFGMSGEFGSGFLTDPIYIVSQLQKHNIAIVQSSEVLRSLHGSPPTLEKGLWTSPVNSPPRGNSPKMGGA